MDKLENTSQWLSQKLSARSHVVHGLSMLIILLLLLNWKIDLSPNTALYASWITLALSLIILTGLFSYLSKLADYLPGLEGLSSSTISILLVVRKLGLSFLGLLFFIGWSLIYMLLWAYDPGACSADPAKSCDSAFYGASGTMEFSKFFYLSINQAFANPPADFFAASTLAQSMSALQLITGVLLITFYAGSFFSLRNFQWGDTRFEDAADKIQDSPDTQFDSK